ncbi:MAG: hypothetical protein OXB88_05325 [Bacteriovoracales bacterium]|nr:hypothetical protein [Bacteriovoracales bacterium]
MEFVRKRKKLKKFIFLSSQKINKRPLYLMPVDATGFFSSSKIECPSCMVKSKGTEKERYYHQFLGATIVHPDLKTVLPVGTEPIDNRFARKAQDCEISAFKRLIVRIKNLYPKLGLVVSGDGLYACGTVIDLVEKCEMGYIFSAKESRVPLPIKYHRWSKERGLAMEREYVTEEGVKVLKKVTHKFSYQNGVSLNNSHDKIKTNILEYREITEWDLKGKEKRKEKKFCWITNITLNERNIWKVMRGGRSRWKIENETFNTLKNQGYNIEHNYGHGKKNLGSNFATLAFLAFAVDQIQEMNCDLFKEALKKCGGYRNGLWDVMRVIHHFFIIESWDFLFLRIITGPIGGCRDGPD